MRIEAGLRQAELAARIGTTQSAVSRMESGRVLPTIGALARVADATGRQVTLVLGPAVVAPARTPETASAPLRPVPRPATGPGRPVPSAVRARRG